VLTEPAQPRPILLLRCSCPSLSLHRPNKEMRRETCPAHRPFCSLPLHPPKPTATTSTAQVPTPIGPPLPLFLLSRLPCLTMRTSLCPHMGTASSAVSWPPRPPHVCSRPTTPIGAASARRSAEPWCRSPPASPPAMTATPHYRRRRRPHRDRSHVASICFKCFRRFRGMLQCF
jgi:hypothetical protein